MSNEGEGRCKSGEECPSVITLRSDMKHHSEAINESLLSIKECTKEIIEASLEAKKISTEFIDIRNRLVEGVERFALQDSKISFINDKMDAVKSNADLAKNKAELALKWIFWIITVPISGALISVLVALIISHLK